MNRIYEDIAILAILAPVTVANAEAASAYADVSKVHEILGQLFLGNMAAETIDFKLEQAQDGAGTGKKDLKASTQRAAHATNNDSTLLQISALTENLDVANGYKFVRLRAITGGATGGPACGVLLGRPRYKPATVLAAAVETAIA